MTRLSATLSSHVNTSLGRLAVHELPQREGASVSAPVLVLWPSILADHQMYERFIEAWSPALRILFIDGPGHGASGPAPGGFRISDCAKAQAEVLDALQIKVPVIAMGTSWGGLVAAEFALAYPERTAALVMLNAPVFPSERNAMQRFVVWGARWLHQTSMYSQGVADSFFLAETQKQAPQYMFRFRQHLAQANGKALSQAVRAVLLEREDLSQRLKDLRVPTLTVLGEHDHMYPLGTLRAAAATIPHGHCVTLPTAHISVVDAPDQVAGEVEAFLRMAGIPATPDISLTEC